MIDVEAAELKGYVNYRHKNTVYNFGPVVTAGDKDRQVGQIIYGGGILVVQFMGRPVMIPDGYVKAVWPRSEAPAAVMIDNEEVATSLIAEKPVKKKRGRPRKKTE